MKSENSFELIVEMFVTSETKQCESLMEKNFFFYNSRMKCKNLQPVPMQLLVIPVFTDFSLIKLIKYLNEKMFSAPAAQAYSAPSGGYSAPSGGYAAPSGGYSGIIFTDFILLFY